MSKFCMNCGNALAADTSFCPGCGTAAGPVSKTPAQSIGQQQSRIGFTQHHMDPAVVARAGKTRKSAWIMTIIFTLGFPIGFFIASQFADELPTKEGLIIGSALGLMMMIIGLVQLNKTQGGTWDGTIINKKHQRRAVHDSNDEINQYRDYYILTITEDNGKKHKVTFANSVDLYNYFSIGDRVRYHKGFRTYEKYDKSRDLVIYCNICGKQNDIGSDTCYFCHLPLFK